MGKFKYLLIDCDDTLLDFGQSEKTAFRNCMVRANLPVGEKYLNLYSSINLRMWKMLEEGKIEKERLIVERFQKYLEEINETFDAKYLNELYIEALSECVFYIKDATYAMQELSKRCEIYIITNGIARVQEKRFSEVNFTPCLSGIFISENIGAEKPSKAYFDSVMKKIPEFKKEEALVVGDSLTSDICGGNNAGIATCWFNPRKLDNHTSAVVNYEIRELIELLDLV